MKLTKIRLRLGLRPRPSWGSFRRSPDPLVGRTGGTPPPHTPPPRPQAIPPLPSPSNTTVVTVPFLALNVDSSSIISVYDSV